MAAAQVLAAAGGLNRQLKVSHILVKPDEEALLEEVQQRLAGAVLCAGRRGRTCEGVLSYMYQHNETRANGMSY